MASYQGITNTLNFAVALNPTTAFPLDARSMFGSLSAAQAAAATAENAGSSNSVYYYGQILTVFENDVATHYSIQGDKTLKAIGNSVAGDDKCIVMSDNVLSLKDFGTQYYAYHEADNILPTGEYTYPDTMPEGVEGAYVQVSGVWYHYTSSAWSVFDGTPHSTSYYELTVGWKAGLEPKVVSAGSGEYALAWYEPSSTTIEGIQSIVGNLQTETEALSGRVDTLEPKVEGIETDLAAAEEDITELSGKMTTVEGAIQTLNGAATVEGSVKKQVNDAIAAVVANAPEDLDTLKEISDWISGHGDDAAAMNSSIQANATAIAALETLVGELPEGISATTVIDYIAEAIEDATGELGSRVGALETKTANLGTAANADVEDFATAAQGAKADTAVQSVTAGTANGSIKVDNGPDVKIYTAPVASTSQVGDVKVDGTSITAAGDGTISVQAVDHTKVTGLDNQIATAKQKATEDANQYTDENAVLTSAIATAAGVAEDAESASDAKVASEKLFVESMTWKTTM